MDTAVMVQRFCHEVLSDADLKAIGKARGFTGKELASRSVLAGLFLGPVGLERALASLNPTEVALLHCLHLHRDPVDISFFTRLYPVPPPTLYYRTFTQQYGDLFKQVRHSLVRKGVLLMAETTQFFPDRTLTQMERWRFRFPQEFQPFLPPLLPQAVPLPGPGEVNHDGVRAKLRELVASTPAATGATQQDGWRVADGSLYLGHEPYRADGLRAWQHRLWQAAVSQVAGAPFGEPLSTALDYIFSQLPPGGWARPQDLTPLLTVFLGTALEGHIPCIAGWQCGLLARRQIETDWCYRPAPEDSAGPPVDPAAYLSPSGADALVVHLDRVPSQALEELAGLAWLEAQRGKLVARAHVATLGNASATLRQGPLAIWLQQHGPGFGHAFQTVAARWGKCLLHENLLVARVRDMSLRIHLERALPADQVLSLPNGFLAFPCGLLPQVKTLLSQADHVLKEVAADA